MNQTATRRQSRASAVPRFEAHMPRQLTAFACKHVQRRTCAPRSGGLHALRGSSFSSQVLRSLVSSSVAATGTSAASFSDTSGGWKTRTTGLPTAHWPVRGRTPALRGSGYSSQLLRSLVSSPVAATGNSAASFSDTGGGWKARTTGLPPAHWPVRGESACAGVARRSATKLCAVLPNTSLKRSTNGRPPGPGWRYAVHFRQPGPGGLPLAPA